MSRYLVTGGTGFLGSHLVAQLKDAGHEVVVLCRANGHTELPTDVSVVEGDILDGDSVKRAAVGCEGLFHCAGRVSRDRQDAAMLYRVHVEGVKTTFDACREAGIKRAVLASSSGVVAVTQDAKDIRNETAAAPLSIIAAWPYYRSKLYAEHSAFERNTNGFEVISVNPSLLLGPGDIRGSSTVDVVNFLEQKVPVVPAGGLSFVDVRDAAAAMRFAMDRGRRGERYLIGGANMSFAAFLGRLERISNVPGPKLRIPRSLSMAKASSYIWDRAKKHLPLDLPMEPVSVEMAQYFWYVDSAKARVELGWEPRDPMDTLADTVEDLYARGVVWPQE